MAYSLYVRSRADRELGKLPREAQDRLDAAIDALADNPKPSASIKLQGREGHRLRVGDYRVLYLVDETHREVTVYRVAHRREVYRR
ncbi:MAG: type II toxin-antitoxin system RelE/ParE family toxin [Rubrobacter sp.]|nr:type II toxin-antitoxin system RelE/ParE family toxin [Rubrobacter sp.]